MRATVHTFRRLRPRQRGMTLLELVIACAILMILATAAMPVARFTVKRQKEAELHRDLREIRDAIDRYKDTADKGRIRVEVGTEGYPPDLQTLVTGVDVVSQGTLGAPLGAGVGAGVGIGGAAGGLGAGGQHGLWLNRLRGERLRGPISGPTPHRPSIPPRGPEPAPCRSPSTYASCGRFPPTP